MPPSRAAMAGQHQLPLLLRIGLTIKEEKQIGQGTEKAPCRKAGADGKGDRQQEAGAEAIEAEGRRAEGQGKRPLPPGGGRQQQGTNGAAEADDKGIIGPEEGRRRQEEKEQRRIDPGGALRCPRLPFPAHALTPLSQNSSL